jgi:hypothetical protein
MSQNCPSVEANHQFYDYKPNGIQIPYELIVKKIKNLINLKLKSES